MTVLVYEHLTSGALAGQPLPAALAHEGEAMLGAIVDDLLTLGHAVTILRDRRLPALRRDSGLHTLWSSDTATFSTHWHRALRECDHILPIAPETGGTLYRLAREAQRHDITLLGCSAQTVALCGDKLRCFHHLARHGIDTPDTCTAQAWLDNAGTTRWVIKPVDGAGCEQTFLLDGEQAYGLISGWSPAQRQQHVVQPWIDGKALSMTLFVGDAKLELLSVNAQHIAHDGQQLHLIRCDVHRDDLLDGHRALTLANRIHATMPGLWGFIGIDVVMSADGRLWVVDINPRLTRSYAEPAMRRTGNPAAPLHHYLTNKGIVLPHEPAS